MTLNKLLIIAATVLLAALGCAGAEWFIHGHKSLPLALGGFAAACYVAAGSWPWVTRSTPNH